MYLVDLDENCIVRVLVVNAVCFADVLKDQVEKWLLFELLVVFALVPQIPLLCYTFELLSDHTLTGFSEENFFSIKSFISFS